MSKDRYENLRYARFALQALRRRVRRFDRNTRKLRRNKARGVELVHQARVSARELRNAMNIFKPLLPGGKTKPWRQAVRDVAKALGEVRDRDVQLMWLDEVLEATDDRKLRPGIERVRLRIAQSQQPHRAASYETLRKLKKKAACDAMRDWLEAEQAAVDDRIISHAVQLAEQSGVVAEQDEQGQLVIRRESAEPASDDHAEDGNKAVDKRSAALMPASADELDQLRDETCRIVLEQFDHLLTYADCVDQPEQVERLHEMRIAAKHLRYSLELFAPIIEGGVADIIELVKHIQQLLGDIHDCDVWAAHLEQFLKDERQRHLDFHGHVRSFGRIVPGVEHLATQRKATRDELYEAFGELWRSRSTGTGWPGIRQALESLRIKPRHRHLFSA